MVPPNVVAVLATAAVALTVRFVASRRGTPESSDPASNGNPEEEEEEDAAAAQQQQFGKPDFVVEPTTITWHNITCVLLDKADKVSKVLLQSVNGEAKAGRLLAIMGPSGSGKTTFLNVLAGQLPASARLRINGSIMINGHPFSSMKHRLAYVRQEDLFFSQLTVRETLSLAAELQLPRTWKSKAKDRYVDELLYRLGLVTCADTAVGDAKTRGISGGEKKRLSIACELIASPSVIFADEPTTGLDAFQAEKVMETLRKLAQEGHTVVCSIHQPRGSIYSKFDDLVLLSSGALVYAGPAHDHALMHFAELGHTCPEHMNPAEYFADLISVDYSSSETEAATKEKIAGLVDAFAQKGVKLNHSFLYGANKAEEEMKVEIQPPQSVAIQRGSWWRQFRLLLRRAWMQVTRDKVTNKVRGNMALTSALIFGSIFWRMGHSQTSIQDRMGLLQVSAGLLSLLSYPVLESLCRVFGGILPVAAVNTAMAALTKTVNVFPTERLIVQREQAKGSYALTPYLVAKLVAEAPVSAAFPLMFGAILYPMARLHPTLGRFSAFSGIVMVEAFAASAMGLTVGAIAPSTEAALALGPSLMTVFIVFGGYYVNSENTPTIFRWIPEVSLIRWAFQALSLNEFKGLKFQATNTFDLSDGEQVLERLSFGKSTVRGAITQEARIALFWYWLTYVLLKRNKPRYQALESPPAAVDPVN